MSGDTQHARVVVKGGYSPTTVHVKAGHPVKLHFSREETSGCSAELVIEDFRIHSKLPAFETTEVEFTPERPGTYPFSCGMGMLRGQIVVE